MKKIFIFFIVFCIVIFYSNNLIAQEIETLWDIQVTTASKHEEKLSDAPGIISVVTSDEISGFAAESLLDVMNRVTSMYMIHAGTFMWNVGSMRGQHSSNLDNHILILLNGRPFRDGMSGGFNNVTYLSFPLGIIDRIEIIRGPGSVLYGTNAYSGVINIITKVADERSEYGASVGYGSYNALSGSLSGNIFVNEDFNINFGARYFNDEGPEFEFWDTPFQVPMPDTTINIPPQQGKGKFTRDNKSAFININYKGFHLNSIYEDLYPYSLALPFKWEMPQGTNPPLSAGDEMTLFQRNFTDLGYNHQFNDNYSLDLNLTYNWFRAEGWVQDDPDPNALKGLTNNTIIEAAFKASPIESLNFILGSLYDYNTFEGAQMTKGNLQKYSTYLQADYKAVSWLKLIAGLQFNKVENIDANFSPRLGIISNFNENWGVKGLYSSAFRNSYPIESHVNHPSFIGNDTLKAELINTAEGQLFYQTEKVQTSVTYFNSHLEDLISPVLSSDSTRLVYSNVGSFSFWGLEYEGKFGISEYLKLITSFTYQENKDGENNVNAAYWPRIIAKAGLLYQREYFSLGIWNSYFGEPRLIEDAFVMDNPIPEAYNLLSANISMDLLELFGIENEYGISISFYGNNLLSKDVIWYPEFSTFSSVNSMPLRGGRSFGGKISFNLIK